MSRIERAKLQVVIQVKTVVGEGTDENPVRGVYRFFYPNGDFIGEVEESHLDINDIASSVVFSAKIR